MKDKTEYKGYTITIEQDMDNESPRDWDNLGTMVCWHRRMNLGDVQLGKDDSKQHYNFCNMEELQEFLSRKDVVSLPLYIYEHGGVTMSTGSFSDPWDSGQVGYIFVTKKKILKEYGGKILTKQLRDRVVGYLKGEVKTYDQFLTGDVYGFMIDDPDGEPEDSCWGYYGYDECLNEAKGQVDWLVKHQAKLQAETEALELTIATEMPAFMI